MAEQHDHGQPDSPHSAPGGLPQPSGPQPRDQNGTGGPNLPALPQPPGGEPAAPPQPRIDPTELEHPIPGGAPHSSEPRPQPPTPQQSSEAPTGSGNLPQPPTGSGNLPSLPQPTAGQPPAHSSAAAAQPHIDPAELEQFRQFQQFQDYLRFTQAQQANQPAPAPDAGLVPATGHQPQTQQGGWQPPAPPNHPGALAPYEQPPRRRRPVPRWLRRLGGKILGWVIVLVILGIAATWAYHRIFPSNEGKSSAQVAAEGGGTYHTNRILPTASPYESVRSVYDGIAQHGLGPKDMVDHVCGLFDQPTQQKFAEDLGYADCRAAVNGIHDRLDPAPTSVNDYAESISKHSGWPPGNTVSVNSCDFVIKGGPALGNFIVGRVANNQWLIVGHSRGPAECPAVPPTTIPS